MIYSPADMVAKGYNARPADIGHGMREGVGRSVCGYDVILQIIMILMKRCW